MLLENQYEECGENNKSIIYIKEIKADNFRLFDKASFFLEEGLNIFKGRNGSGKTSILEIVSLSLCGNSFRTQDLKEVIKENKEYTLAEVKYCSEKKEQKALFTIKKDGKKEYSREENIKISSFTQKDIETLRGEPQHRRRFIDEMISGLDNIYREAVNEYSRTLIQRNKLLKTAFYEKVEENLRVWDEKLIKTGTKISQLRMEWLKRLNEIIKTTEEAYFSKQVINLAYYMAGSDKIEEYSEKMERSKKRDMRVGNTLIGPHRDEIMFKYNGKTLRTKASSGQQRETAFILRSAECELYIKSGRTAVLLIDDPFSEVDEKAKERMVRHLKKYRQALVTTVDWCPEEANIIHME